MMCGVLWNETKIIAPDKKGYPLNIFSLFLHIEAFLMNTHNVCFQGKIRKYFSVEKKKHLIRSNEILWKGLVT